MKDYGLTFQNSGLGFKSRVQGSVFTAYCVRIG